MRIAFLTREYPPDTAWGGIATLYYNLAKALAQRGHEVHVICQAVGKPKDYIEQGVFVHRVGTNPKRYSAVARIDYSFNAWRKLREITKMYDIEIVDASFWGAEGFLYSLFKGPPLIIRADISALDVLKTKTYSGRKEFLSLKILSLLEDFTVKRADRVVANSQAIYAHLATEIHIAPDKVDIVHHAVDTTKFKFVKSDIRHKLGISDTVRLVLCVGRLEMRKGYHILCQAIPCIIEHRPDTKFVLLGRDTETAPNGGSFKRYIVNKAQDGNFGNNLVFIDFISEDELIQLYSSCDVFVSASLQESFGLTVIEAMACGKPIVATPVGIVPELQSYGLKGLSVVPISGKQDLADAVINFLSLKDNDRKQLARQNRQLVEKEFSLARWTDKMLKIYEKASKTRRQSKTQLKVKHFFDHDAGVRDREFQQNPILGYEQMMRQRTISSLIHDDYSVVLDAGCGNGRDFSILLQYAHRLVGIDFSQGMVREAKTKLDNVANKEQISLVVGDVSRLPVSDASFDLVVCSEVLEHVPNWLEALGEFNRVLKPNGELIISTPNKLSMYGLTRYLGRLLLGSKHPYDKWKSYFELRNALKSYGFEVNQAKGACYLPGDIGYYQPFKQVIASCLGIIRFLERTFLSRLLPFKLLGYIIVIKSIKEL